MHRPSGTTIRADSAKFLRISFAPDGSIAGANVDWYLLETSRVMVRSEAERSFHVFYQLLEGDSDLKSQ